MNIWKSLNVISILIILLGGVYLLTHRMIESKRNSELVSQTISEQIASNAPILMTEKEVPNLPTDITTTHSSWIQKTYLEYKYSISVPNDLIEQSTELSKIFIFPKNIYFRWPLQDYVHITITASSTCIINSVLAVPFIASSTFYLNNQLFQAYEYKNIIEDKIYRERIYSTKIKDICYIFSLYSHGSNGARLYVSGQALIKKYDNHHTEDLQKVENVFNSIVKSLRTVED